MLSKRKFAALSGILIMTSGWLWSATSYAWGAKNAQTAQESNITATSVVAKNDTQNSASSKNNNTQTDTEEKVNINTASMETLQNMKFMSKTKAQKIVKYREEHGPFKTIDELLNVKCRGIHQNWLDKVSNMFII